MCLGASLFVAVAALLGCVSASPFTAGRLHDTLAEDSLSTDLLSRCKLKWFTTYLDHFGRVRKPGLGVPACRVSSTMQAHNAHACYHLRCRNPAKLLVPQGMQVFRKTDTYAPRALSAHDVAATICANKLQPAPLAQLVICITITIECRPLDQTVKTNSSCATMSAPTSTGQPQQRRHLVLSSSTWATSPMYAPPSLTSYSLLVWKCEVTLVCRFDKLLLVCRQHRWLESCVPVVRCCDAM